MDIILIYIIPFILGVLLRKYGWKPKNKYRVKVVKIDDVTKYYPQVGIWLLWRAWRNIDFVYDDISKAKEAIKDYKERHQEGEKEYIKVE